MSSRKQTDSKKHTKLLNSSSEGEDAQSSQENSSSSKHNSEQEYTVQAIRSHRGVGTSREYFIKWENYPEEQNTWEPLSHLNNIKNMIKDYESKIKTQKASSSSKADSSSSDSKLIQLKKKPAAKTITKDAQKLLTQTSNLQAKNNIDLSNATNILKDHNNSQIQFEKQTNSTSKANLLFGKTEQIIAAAVQENKSTSQPNNSLLAAVLSGSMSKKQEKTGGAGAGAGNDCAEQIAGTSKNSNSNIELRKRNHSQMESLLSQFSQDTQPIKKNKTDTNDISSNTTTPTKTAGIITSAMIDSSISTSISKSVIGLNESAPSSSSLMQTILNKETAKTASQDGTNNSLNKKNGSSNLMNMLLSTKSQSQQQQQQQQQQSSSSKLERMLAEGSPTKEIPSEGDCEVSLITRQNKELLRVLEGESEMFKRQFAQSANSNGKGDDDDNDNDDDYDDDDNYKSKNNNGVLFDLQKDLVEFKGSNLASIKASKAAIQAVIIKELNQELFKKSKLVQDVVTRQQIQESYCKFEFLVPFSFRNVSEKKGKDKVKETKSKEKGLIQKDNQSDRQRQGEYKDDDNDGGRIVAEQEIQGQQLVDLAKRDNLSSSSVVNTASEFNKVKGTFEDNCSDRVIGEELNKTTDNQFENLKNVSNSFKKNSDIISMNEESDHTINISTIANPNKLSISLEKQQDMNIPSFQQQPPQMGINPLVINNNNNTQPFSNSLPNPPLIKIPGVSQSQKSFQSDQMNSQINRQYSIQEKDILNLPETTNQKGQIKENLRDLNNTSLGGAKQFEEQRIPEEIITKQRRIDLDTPAQFSNSSSLSQQAQVSNSSQFHHSTRPLDSANQSQEKASLLPFTSSKDISEKKSDNLYQSLKSSQEQELNSPSIKSSLSKFSDPSQPLNTMDSMSRRHSTSPFSSQPYRDGHSIKSSSRHENSKSPSKKKDHKHRDKDSKSSRRRDRSGDRNRSSSKSKKDKKNKRSSNGRSRSRSPSMRIAPKNRKNSISRSRSSSSLRVSKNSSTQLGSSQTAYVKNGATIKTASQAKPLPTAPGPTKKVFNPFQRNTIYDEDEDEEDQIQEQEQAIKKQSSGENSKDKHSNGMEKGKSVVKKIDPKDKDDDIWDDGDDDICSTSDKNSSFQKNSMVSYNVNPYDEDYSKPNVSYQQQQQQQQQQHDNKSALNNSSFRRESGFDQQPKYNEKNNNNNTNSFHNDYSFNDTQSSSSYNKNSNTHLRRQDDKKRDEFDRDDKEAWQKQQKPYSQNQYSDKENLKSNDNMSYNRLKDDHPQGATSKQDLNQVSKPKDLEGQRNISIQNQPKSSETVAAAVVVTPPPIPTQILRDPRLKFRNSEQQKDNEKQLKEFGEKQQNIFKSLGEIGCPMLDAPARISHHLVWNNQMFFKVIWKPRESKIQMPPTFIEFVKVQEAYPNILNQYVLSSLQKQNTFLS